MRPDRAIGALVCDHCGTHQESPVLLRHLEVSGDSSFACPICATSMSEGRLDGHALAFCQRCRGMLIDMKQFAAVIEVARVHLESSYEHVQPRRQNPGERIVQCPGCRQPMLNHIYGGPGNVVIDTCEHCLLNWLDPDELRRIAGAPRRPRAD
jgi:Zn-finger nucleic acid-binding protein